jgi:hypothetical protein
MSVPTSTTTLCFSTGDSRLSPASTDSAQSWRQYGAGSSYSRDAQAKPLIAAILTAPEGMVDQPGNSRNSGTTRSQRNSMNNNNEALLWVTSNTLDGFKDKDVMRKVRKAAMDDHLRKNPKHSTRQHENRAREQRVEDRIHSVGSGISDDQEPSLTSNEWALQAIIGGRSRRPSLQSNLTQSTTDVLEDEDPPSDSLAVRPPNSLQLGMENILSIPISIPMQTPVVVLPRPGRLPYDRVVVGPLKSLGAPLDPFCTMPQVSHPRVSIEELKTHCETHRFRTPSAFWRPGAIFNPAPLYQCSTNANQVVGSSGQRRWD